MSAHDTVGTEKKRLTLTPPRTLENGRILLTDVTVCFFLTCVLVCVCLFRVRVFFCVWVLLWFGLFMVRAILGSGSGLAQAFVGSCDYLVRTIIWYQVIFSVRIIWW